MIYIAICDDEKYMCDHIEAFASLFFRKKNKEAAILRFYCGEELLQYDGQIDILFLDIQMKDIDGMETARKLRADKFRGFLIFITVLKEMVFQSFEVQAYDYLVKPVEEEQFEKTMERLYVSMQNTGKSGLLVQKGYESLIILKDDIVFCEVIDRKIYLNLVSGEAIDIEYSVKIAASEGAAGYLSSHWQQFAVHFLGLASLFCMLFTYKKLQQNFRLSTELSLLEQEEHSLRQYVEEAKTRYDETKSFRHDIRNHITVVKKLLQGGKIEQAADYIEDMDDIVEKMAFPCSTNNPVVDILVRNKLGIAKSIGISVSCSLLLPYPCGLRDIDICIVLSNALDNAIHACKNADAGIEKYIHVSGRMQGDFLMIETRNSFQGEKMFKKGTGLSNVKKVAEKYGGAMSIETQGNVFVLHVLLIIPQQGGDQQGAA